MMLICSVVTQLILVSISFANENFRQQREFHYPKEINHVQLKYLAGLSDIKNMDSLLDEIMIPRVVGTKGHEKVGRFISNQLEKMGWNVEIDEFYEKVPNFGNLTFKNIIGTLNPAAERFLVLGCHYDSKYFENGDFLGAIDSAVPCAMMLNLIKVMKEDLKNSHGNNVSLKLIFFDGEEAFKYWTKTDSLYGSRHLAKTMDTNTFLTKTRDTVKDIERIDLLLLLDLIGFSNPKFYSFFKSTEKWYIRLVNIERRLYELGLLNVPRIVFNNKSTLANIDDDHVPFLEKGVPILHLIPIPFPEEWHTLADNRDIVDLQVTENINKVIRVFVAEYLHLLLKEEDYSIKEKSEL